MPKMNVIKSIYIDSTPELVDLKTGAKRTTRDILVVSGYLNQHHLTVLVNHWPSRRGEKCDLLPNDSKLRNYTEELQIQFLANTRRVKS